MASSLGWDINFFINVYQRYSDGPGGGAIPVVGSSRARVLQLSAVTPVQEYDWQ